MKRILLACAAVAAMVLVGCGSSTAGSAPVAPTLTAYNDETGAPLPTVARGLNTWFVGEMEQALHFTPTTRGGLATGEKGLRITTVSNHDVAVDYDYVRLNTLVIAIHQTGDYRVELLCGLEGGDYEVVGWCWLRIQ